MNDYIMEVKNVSFKYPGACMALENLSINIRRGKKTVFMGENGSGKSTLFLHLNGILKPCKGELLLNSLPIKYDKQSLNNLRKNVGIVFQDPDSQLFSASVIQEVSFGPLNIGMSKEEVKKNINYALEITGIIDLKDTPTHFLSYGHKKRVSIASIIAMKPKVIIFDEPTTYLDPKHKQQIMEFLTELNKNGTTIILSSHDVNLAYSWADHIVVMKNGSILKEGLPEEIFLDSSLLNKANLICPIIIEVYNKLKAKNLLTNTSILPKSTTELVNIIK